MSNFLKVYYQGTLVYLAFPFLMLGNGGETMLDVDEICNAILHGGIRKTKFKNSKIQSITYTPEGTKGAIFGFRSKKHMIDGRGIVLTSEEGLNENADRLTHWTPNVYQYGSYTDEQRLFVKGHCEKNLKQINCFVLDFDKIPGSNLSDQDILDVAIDLDLMPTLLLETPGGYQAYFILEKPWFISKKNDYQSIRIAKLVSQNLRKSFAAKIPEVDLGCNHFGIARIPRTDNVIYYYPALTHDMQDLIAWSMAQDPEATYARPNLKVLKPTKQIQEKWVDLLLKNPEIVGEKGKFGRNNVIFTLALAYYASNVDQARCIDDMDLFNSNLTRPLNASEVDRIIRSAYSGKYQGASTVYVSELLANWGSESLSGTPLFSQNRNGWFKFKKERSERTNSHVHEWKVDLLAFLEKECVTYRPEIKLTKSELQASVTYNGKAISRGSLERALQELVSEGKLYLQMKAGRGGGMILATRKALIRTVIKTNQVVKDAYKHAIRTFFPEAARLTKLFEQPSKAEPISLFGGQEIRAGTG